MSVVHRYRDFGHAASPEGSEEEDVFEDVKLDAFETGYQAGWDDAVKAHTVEADKVTSELSQRLEDMSFTYHEVFSKLTLAMKPLMVSLVEKLLPDIAEKSLHAHILQEISALVEAHADGALEIAVSPAHRSALEGALEDKLDLPFRFQADSSLTAGQVYVRIGEAEREIDLDTVLQGVSEAVEAFFEQVKPEIKNE